MSENLIINTDGGARGNPGPAAVGVVIKTEKDKIIKRISRNIGITTNNEAEYQALITALEYLAENSGNLSLKSVKTIKIFIDSSLIVNQVNGLFKVKNSRLREHIYRIRELEQEIPVSIVYNLIPREKNRQADQLVNLALDE
ncbi:hypothetical protein A3D05_02350 [Candidatus Gottesmanbacteria bacterium RIFCSPHIGHO2_02_FULL_40_24]|uniref:RNase H type-1 domain-containing protein n=1 Tax=Candidatus Gottesmanbacteria bacterium RIFCSPHIGHO2_01_FULL_40_15 TaxID=1798376 RepID=A0A1F5Z488_9BACT|nr:MAG: hypothetical protein A2777_03905 [Candidatus Gottesmanbacteria bacterium RIFCSPHIGHO2_01_FULL_40_15]OGG18692.1 MAG: hypothetical protein A3D05_02350 [Candidatus Gottesmanbacteria bacterium RIFCSPHIGHO2_02_FULL_40_24]OGG22984.1 MAG: hypothetical protein A3E42_06560 [Candidatus Gottesmanbacteria bacterium RIFCSPHIGHO2_12_FULL_40_13]OGG23296.1 MAG: hypothetical protein A3B48_06495 [Candidatus Gottesmanbacteria bacterium RIFCSPLOWO2_01_FULL_40_10]OGG31902.1 MAG: hypothetical protein A3I80_0